MKVLVTGANGFIGQHLVKKLVESGYYVYGLVMANTSLGELELINNTNLRLISGDLIDYNSLLKATKDADAIIHLAGLVKYIHVSKKVYWNVNVSGTENLIKACLENKKTLSRFVYCSTVDVYGEAKYEDIIDEDYPCKHENVYSRTKYESELVCMKYYKEYGIPVAIIRSGRVYGPGDLTLKPLLKLIKRRLFFNIGRKDVYTMPVYIDDLVNALILALEVPKAVGSTYIIAGKEVITKKEFIETIAKELNVKPTRLSLPKWLVIPPVYFIEKSSLFFNKRPILSREKLEFFLKSRRFNINKAKNELGYSPSTSITEGLRKTIEWYKKRQII